MRTFNPRDEYQACCALLLAIIERAVLDDDSDFLAECAPNVRAQFQSANFMLAMRKHNVHNRRHQKQARPG